MAHLHARELYLAPLWPFLRCRSVPLDFSFLVDVVGIVEETLDRVHIVLNFRAVSGGGINAGLRAEVSILANT